MLRGHCGRPCWRQTNGSHGSPGDALYTPGPSLRPLVRSRRQAVKSRLHTGLLLSPWLRTDLLLTSAADESYSQKTIRKRHALRLNLHHVLPRAGDSSGKPKAFSVTVRAALVRTAGSPRHTPGRPTALTRQHVRLRSYSPKSGSNRHFEISSKSSIFAFFTASPFVPVLAPVKPSFPFTRLSHDGSVTAPHGFCKRISSR